ncbi:MAG TPA: hypothetical protein P5300_03125 [Acidobacteriota bacterium]|nr:hypothetical protein [Acidobacteriota bacterium]
MTRYRIYFGLVLGLLWSFPAPAAAETEEPDLPLNELLGNREYRLFQEKERYRDRLQILRRAVEGRAHLLPEQIEDHTLDAVNRTLYELRSLVRHALRLSEAETNQKELQHREVKQLEIRLRKLTTELYDWSMAVPLENRDSFEETRSAVEKLRNRLLRQLFGSALGEPVGASAMPSSLQSSFLPVGSGSAGAASAQSLLDLDKFTEEEFRKIQYTTKLSKRIDVFVDIARRRLDEIERRRDNRDEEEEEPNPLEFYTYQELLHAYNRALDSAMANIDERATRRLDEEKEIRKALQNLGKHLQEMADRLNALQPFIREQRDEALAETYEEALRLTDIAQKGVQFGLGAPPE